MSVFSLRRENLSQRPLFFSEIVFACGRLINWRVTFGNSFFHSKSCLKDISSVFQTAFWVKKEFPNGTRQLISPPQAKIFSGKIRSLRQKNWKFNFFLKNEKKNNTSRRPFGRGLNVGPYNLGLKPLSIGRSHLFGRQPPLHKPVRSAAKNVF